VKNEIKNAPDKIIRSVVISFFCMVPWSSAYIKAYSGEQTNSQLGTPIVDRTTTIFFVQLYNSRYKKKINILIKNSYKKRY